MQAQMNRFNQFCWITPYLRKHEWINLINFAEWLPNNTSMNESIKSILLNDSPTTHAQMNWINQFCKMTPQLRKQEWINWINFAEWLPNYASTE